MSTILQSLKTILNSESWRTIARHGKNVFFPVIVILSILMIMMSYGAMRSTISLHGPFDAEAPPSQLKLIQVSGPKLDCCLHVDSDGGGNETASDLRFSVSGRPIGPPHTLHEKLRRGEAGYSHWGSAIYFALPDGTPNSADTVVTYSYPVRPNGLLAALVLLTTFFSGAYVFRRPASWLLRQANVLAYPSQRSAEDAAKPEAARSIAFVALGLFVLFIAIAWRLREPDLEFNFEADFDAARISMWRSFLNTFDFASLAHPPPHHPYLDGQFIFYAVVAELLELGAKIFPAMRSSFPNTESYNLGAAVYGNIASYALAGVIFFLALVRLTGRKFIAALAALGFFLAPQMINISIVRVDYLIALPIAAVFYCSMKIASGEELRRHAIILGLALAFVSTLKINGLFYILFPLIAVAAHLLSVRRTDFRRLVSFATLAGVVFLIAFALLMARYLYWLSPAEILEYYISTIEDVQRWVTSYNSPGFLFNNIELMMGHGYFFIVLYVACAGMVIWLAATQRSGSAIFLAIAVIALSLAAGTSFKNPRSGYHLLPIFFACIAYATDALLRRHLSFWVKSSLTSTIASIFAWSLLLSIINLEIRSAEMMTRFETVDALKRRPRQWLATHIEQGATICILVDSLWTLPPLGGLGFQLSDAPFLVPYLEPERLGSFEPPRIGELSSHCEAVIISDWHKKYFNAALTEANPETGAKWVAFYDELEKEYPPKRFFDPVGISSVHQVEIFELQR